MNRKYLNYAVFLAIVLLVVGLAVRHSQYMRGLVDGMAGNDRAVRISSARTLVEGEQFMDAITGETIPSRVKIAQALEDWASEPAPAQTPADSKAKLPKDAITQMIAFMKDPDRPVRDRLLLAMVAAASKSADNLGGAVAGLKEGDANARKCVVSALQIVGQTDARKALALAAKAAPDNKPAERTHAVSERNLQVASQLIAKVVETMAKAPEARVAGGDVLGALVDTREQSVAALMPLLSDKDAGVREGAAVAMGKVGSKTPIPALVKMMTGDTPTIRTQAIIAIAMIADPSGEPPLAEALANTHDEGEARIQAALGLGKIGTPTAVSALTSALTAFDLRVVAAAVTGLATTGASAVPSLVSTAQSPNPLVRQHAVEALGKIASPAANEALAKALDDADPRVRIAAADGLGYAGNAGGVEPLAAKLGGEDGSLAAGASDALAKIGMPAQASLVRALSGSEQAAYFAAQALGKMGSSATAPVMAAAEGHGPATRWCAVALGQIGGPAAVDTLRRLSASSDADVRQAAQISLQRLGVL